MKFEKLPIHAKQVILEEFGELISSLTDGKEVTELYLLNDFYVEIFYIGAKASKIEKINDSQRLMLYCPELDF